MLQGRDWVAQPGASEAEIAKLRAAAPTGTPEQYFSLLAECNGGEGPLPILPLNFCLDPIAAVLDAAGSRNYDRPDLDGFFLIGGNGGGELIAFDTRGNEPWPVVTVEMVGGADSAEIVAIDFESFLKVIGTSRTDPT